MARRRRGGAFFSIWLASVAAAAALADPVGAQERDAYVLPWGAVRLAATAVSSRSEETDLGPRGLDVSFSTRSVPLRLGAGLLPRIEVGVAMPLVRGDRLVRRIQLTADETPEDALPGPRRHQTQWSPSDLEVDVRFQAFGGGPDRYPTGEATLYRLAIGGVVRLPTGRIDLPDPLFREGPEAGASAVRLEAVADAFPGERFWGTVSAALDLRPARDTLIAGGMPRSGAAPIPVRVSRTSGLEASFVGRFRLSPGVSIGASALTEHAGAVIDESGAGLVDRVASSRQWLGFMIRYSTVPAREQGSAILPLEVAAGYTAAVRGSPAGVSERRTFFGVSIDQALWGGR